MANPNAYWKWGKMGSPHDITNKDVDRLATVIGSYALPKDRAVDIVNTMLVWAWSNGYRLSDQSPSVGKHFR